MVECEDEGVMAAVVEEIVAEVERVSR